MQGGFDPALHLTMLEHLALSITSFFESDREAEKKKAQVIGVLKQISGLGNVFALAHLGGASAGVLFWLHSRQTVSASKKEKPAVGI